jgi:hypothetical protein
VIQDRVQWRTVTNMAGDLGFSEKRENCCVASKGRSWVWFDIFGYAHEL